LSSDNKFSNLQSDIFWKRQNFTYKWSRKSEVTNNETKINWSKTWKHFDQHYLYTSTVEWWCSQVLLF